MYHRHEIMIPNDFPFFFRQINQPVLKRLARPPDLQPRHSHQVKMILGINSVRSTETWNITIYTSYFWVTSPPINAPWDFSPSTTIQLPFIKGFNIFWQSPFLAAGDLDCFVSHSSWISMELHLVVASAAGAWEFANENGKLTKFINKHGRFKQQK